MRVLVTGAQGFVGHYMVSALRADLQNDGDLIATGLRSGANDDFDVIRLDITDAARVEREMRRLAPTHVVHLAGLSTISAAVENEALAWRVHLYGTLNVARAIMAHAPKATLIHVGSGQIYGATSRDGMALKESSLVAPTSIYMASKAAADLAIGALAEQGLRSVRFRPFNHTGVGQSDRFALPRFAQQISRIKAGRQPPRIEVGNLDTERDFLDVRDVVAAYNLAILKADEIMPGEIFNIASGTPLRMRDIINQMCALSGIDPQLETNPDLVRSSDVTRFVGDAGKARRILGWTPRHSFTDTLSGIVSEWETRELITSPP
jgi:GDP-4-dehydro-6-deoxy-D-mannose reductase